MAGSIASSSCGTSYLLSPLRHCGPGCERNDSMLSSRYILLSGASYAPARAMIHAGVPVAFGSDFNPGSCPISSLQIAMNIGCYRFQRPAECLTAVTLNAAAAICREKRTGSLEARQTSGYRRLGRSKPGVSVLSIERIWFLLFLKKGGGSYKERSARPDASNVGRLSKN